MRVRICAFVLSRYLFTIINNNKMLRNILKSIYNKNQIRLISSDVTFGFKLNRFNDIHIGSNDVVKIFKEIDSDLNKFDSILKSF